LELESRGYRAPTSSEIEEAIIQARVEGKDDAFIEVPPPQKT
jgi:hypothetical protein